MVYQHLGQVESRLLRQRSHHGLQSPYENAKKIMVHYQPTGSQCGLSRLNSCSGKEEIELTSAVVEPLLVLGQLLQEGQKWILFVALRPCAASVALCAWAWGSSVGLVPVLPIDVDPMPRGRAAICVGRNSTKHWIVSWCSRSHHSRVVRCSHRCVVAVLRLNGAGVSPVEAPMGVGEKA